MILARSRYLASTENLSSDLFYSLQLEGCVYPGRVTVQLRNADLKDLVVHKPLDVVLGLSVVVVLVVRVHGELLVPLGRKYGVDDIIGNREELDEVLS